MRNQHGEVRDGAGLTGQALEEDMTLCWLEQEEGLQKDRRGGAGLVRSIKSGSERC